MGEGRYSIEEEDFKTIIEFSPFSIVITDIDGKINYVNPKFTETTGYLPKEIIGEKPSLLRSTETNPEEYKLMWDTILSGKLWRGELANRKKNGEIYHELCVVFPIIDHTGKITKFIGVNEDITTLKEKENKLQKVEKLKELAKMSSYIAHEIKSPLTSIKMNLDMLVRKNDLPEHANKSLSIVQSEVTRLLNLLKNILEYSKRERLSLTEIYLPDFVNSISDTFLSQFEEKDIRFVNNVLKDRVLGDIEKLKSAFMLLIENSIAAVSSNGIIEIYSNSTNGKCHIYIKDNGCGIDNNENIFEPYFTTKEYGTGLGLVIARNIIERNNGQINLLSSKPGETIFDVTLEGSEN